MKHIVSRTSAVAALLFVAACGSSQKQLTGPQQAAAQAEDQAQKAHAEAQKARDDANKAQQDYADALKTNRDARQAELDADDRAEKASLAAGAAEQKAGYAARPPMQQPEHKGVAEAQGMPHEGHDSAGKVVVITASLLFATNSSELLPSAKPKLDEVAKALQAQPQANNVMVQGHTDSTGPAEINDKLSQERADAVADYLESKGVPKERITAQGLSDTQPASDTHNAEGRAINRRVDIMIQPAEGQDKKAPAGPQPQAQPPQQHP